MIVDNFQRYSLKEDMRELRAEGAGGVLLRESALEEYFNEIREQMSYGD